MLSAATPRLQLPDDRARALMERIQDAGTEVVKAKVSLLPCQCSLQGRGPTPQLCAETLLTMVMVRSSPVLLGGGWVREC